MLRSAAGPSHRELLKYRVRLISFRMRATLPRYLVGGRGPAEGLCAVVVVGHEGVDAGYELLGAGERATTDLALAEDAEPALDLIAPGGVGRGVVTWKRGRLASQALTLACLWVP
jgi:hypothetical protein